MPRVPPGGLRALGVAEDDSVALSCATTSRLFVKCQLMGTAQAPS
jgi:hypothetical protein